MLFIDLKIKISAQSFYVSLFKKKIYEKKANFYHRKSFEFFLLQDLILKKALNYFKFQILYY